MRLPRTNLFDKPIERSARGYLDDVHFLLGGPQGYKIRATPPSTNVVLRYHERFTVRDQAIHYRFLVDIHLRRLQASRTDSPGNFPFFRARSINQTVVAVPKIMHRIAKAPLSFQLAATETDSEIHKRTAKPFTLRKRPRRKSREGDSSKSFGHRRFLSLPALDQRHNISLKIV